MRITLEVRSLWWDTICQLIHLVGNQNNKVKFHHERLHATVMNRLPSPSNRIGKDDQNDQRNVWG
jgi:hypothetical protein